MFRSIGPLREIENCCAFVPLHARKGARVHAYVTDMALAAILHKIVARLLPLSVPYAMSASPQDFKKMGRVYIVSGGFRAHLQLRDGSGSNKNIYGPCRAKVDAAQADLQAIREAGVPFHDDRPKALEAMMEVTQRLQKDAIKSRDLTLPLSEAGHVAACDGFFRADVQYLATTGQYAHLRGPKHTSAAEAQREWPWRMALMPRPCQSVTPNSPLNGASGPGLSMKYWLRAIGLIMPCNALFLYLLPGQQHSGVCGWRP